MKKPGTAPTCVRARYAGDERDMQTMFCNNTSLHARGVLTENVMTTELVLANKITSIPNLSTAAGTTGVGKQDTTDITSNQINTHTHTQYHQIFDAV